MPKGHPISVPRTWPGHRDYSPSRDEQEQAKMRPFRLDELQREQQERWNALPREARARVGLVPECPVPGGSCLLCDDDHCREL